MRGFQRSDIPLSLSGCRFITKKLYFHSVGIHRRTVQYNEWSIRSERKLMELARKNFFTRPGRSRNQNAAIGRRYFF